MTNLQNIKIQYIKILMVKNWVKCFDLVQISVQLMLVVLSEISSVFIYEEYMQGLQPIQRIIYPRVKLRKITENMRKRSVEVPI